LRLVADGYRVAEIANRLRSEAVRNGACRRARLQRLQRSILLPMMIPA